MRFSKFGHDHEHAHAQPELAAKEHHLETTSKGMNYHDEPRSSDLAVTEDDSRQSQCPAEQYVPGADHLSHTRDHHQDQETASHSHVAKTFDPESYAARMTALFILEFGVVFHSIFIGLTLAVAGPEFITLYIVLTFHQTFEGLALGSRLGSMEWKASKKYLPYIMACGYGISTPIAIAIGLGVRTTFSPNSQTTLIGKQNGMHLSLALTDLLSPSSQRYLRQPLGGDTDLHWPCGNYGPRVCVQRAHERRPN